jgi:predicted AlkP superfamily pyrophosphatase or phosphodiesterase
MGMKTRRFIIFFCLILGLVTTVSAKWKAKHVVLIGMDGWGAYCVEKADMPNVKALMQNGSYSLETRSVLPSSSAVNWASMFMGAAPEIHGYTEWSSRTPELPSREISHYGIFPTIWGLFRDQYPKAEIGYIYEWVGMGFLVEKDAMNKFFQADETDTKGSCVKESVEYIKSAKPNLLGIIFAQPDGVGHNDGHDTEAYYQKLKELDQYVGDIVQAVKDAGIYDDTIFILTADHGGIGKGHGGKTMQEMQIPLIFCGKGIKKGYNFKESTMIYDIASTIAYIFDVKQPQVWIGRPAKQIFK